ncbi:Uncharacterised protein [Mycobacteroides abscessus subsp. abscessus]|nr:Uncharacterised protein [Mycobacteroides abscessus subsp. abscessus]
MTRTSCPASVKCRMTEHTLYAAMPPPTPTRMRRLASGVDISCECYSPSVC